MWAFFTNMLWRTLITVILFLSIFLLPWWITVSVLFGALMLIPRYLEGCVVACVFDLVYAGSPLFGSAGFVTVSAVFIFVIPTYVVLPHLRHDVFTAS